MFEVALALHIGLVAATSRCARCNECTDMSASAAGAGSFLFQLAVGRAMSRGAEIRNQVSSTAPAVTVARLNSSAQFADVFTLREGIIS